MKGQKIIDYLRSHRVNFEEINHPETYTAQKTAKVMHIPGREVAKPVMVKIDGKLVMFVLSANERISAHKLKELFGASEVSLASESEFCGIFRDCESGAMPPFGNLYGVEEYVSETLSKDSSIVFNAGTHSKLIRMNFADFQKLVSPKLVNLSALY